MEKEYIELLTSEAVRVEIEENIDRDPTHIALDKHLRYPREVASQVKYLQRARKKLPTYYASRAILPALAFEQSSSEECAANKSFSGSLAVDMTCGLGVDTLYLSRNFERVVTIERNPALAALARHNFALMGAKNVEVVEGESEEYIASIEHADLIYADPDRRSAEGKKMVCLEECSPNIVALLPLLRSKSERLCFKLSPMFDVSEALRTFGEGSNIEVVSLGGECKEVVVDWQAGRQGHTIKATALGCGTFQAEVGTNLKPQGKSDTPPQTATFDEVYSNFGCLVVPDVALRKAGVSEQWCAENNMELWGSYGFCATLPQEPIMGHAYGIELAMPYRPKELKRVMSKKVEVIRHGFPHPTAAICKALGVREGAGQRWAFAEIDHSLWAFRLK